MGRKLTDADKANLEELQPMQEVLRVLVTALGRAMPSTMPTVARTVRDLTGNPSLSLVALVMLYDLADGIDLATGVDTEQGPPPGAPPATQ